MHRVLIVALVFAGTFTAGYVEAFNSNLVRPWEKTFKRSHPITIRFYVDEHGQIKAKEESQDEQEDEEGKQEDDEASSVSLKTNKITGSSANALSSGAAVSRALSSNHSLATTTNTPVNGEQSKRQPKVVEVLPELIAMTRPANIPGIILFHMLGVYLAVGSSAVWEVLLQPTMMVTLLALQLTSATSMLVNDYYDYKMGHDNNKINKPLPSHRLDLHVTKRFLSYLYAAALICVALVPGVPARLAVVVSLMLTFWYTQHLKPRTWLKNVVCASLIALSPLASGVAAIAVEDFNADTDLSALVRLVTMLFIAIMGREITMDINDVEDDSYYGVRTVPVVYGRKFASTVGFVCTLVAFALALSGPLLDWVVGAALNGDALRKLGLASAGFSGLLLRSWQVMKCEGQDPAVVETAVKEGLLYVVLVLASFV